MDNLMGIIIAVMIQKGGNAKTTTASNLAFGLYDKGYNVLLVDLDSQRNLTQATTFKFIDGANSIYSILNGSKDKKDVIINIRENSCNKLDLIPSSKELSSYIEEYAQYTLSMQLLKGLYLDSKFQVLPGKEEEYTKAYEMLKNLNVNTNMKSLEELLRSLRDYYDYIIVDTPPELNSFTSSIMKECDGITIPLQADEFSRSALIDFIESLILNKVDMSKVGLLYTRYDKRGNFTGSSAVNLNKLAKEYGITIFKPPIRETIRIKESQSKAKSIFEFAFKSDVASDYDKFVKQAIKFYKRKGEEK